jgi:hypothetical protein
MESMHQFLMARYQIADYEEYKYLLALLRNTRAIAAHKARSRHAHLWHLQDTVDNARNQIIHQLKEGRCIR